MNDDRYNMERRRIIDEEFKTAVHKPTVLAWLLHECLDEFRCASIDEIKKCLGVKPHSTYVKGRETEYFSDKNGTVRMDNIFDVMVPGTNDRISIILDVEGQNDDGDLEYIGKRAEYYISRLVCRQKGNEFSGTDYKDIRRTYSLWVMMEPLADQRNTLIRYSMKPQVMVGNTKRVVTLDTFNIIFLYLGSRYSDDLPEGVRFATALLTLSLSEEERREILTKKYNIPDREYPKEGLMNMSCIYEDTKRRFTREGGIEVGTAAVKSVMEKMNLSPDEAFDLLNIESKYRQFILDDLKKDGTI